MVYTKHYEIKSSEESEVRAKAACVFETAGENVPARLSGLPTCPAEASAEMAWPRAAQADLPAACKTGSDQALGTASVQGQVPIWMHPDHRLLSHRPQKSRYQPGSAPSSAARRWCIFQSGCRCPRAPSSECVTPWVPSPRTPPATGPATAPRGDVAGLKPTCARGRHSRERSSY